MKTAVEWLEIEIQKSIIPAQKDYFKWAFDQAKEMEKKQIVDTYVVGYGKGITHGAINAEQYYNETFKSE
jgi:hypothetical protein